MKTKTLFDRKLVLGKETIVDLDREGMSALHGGGGDSTVITRCPSYCYCPRTILFSNCC
jgi:hypothetical protein